MTELDRNLIRQARVAPRKDAISQSDRIAANVLWRDGVPIPVLVKLFKRSKNTLFYSAFTGEAASYPRSHPAREINDLVEALGVDEARRRYVTEDMTQAVNEALAAKVASYSK